MNHLNGLFSIEPNCHTVCNGKAGCRCVDMKTNNKSRINYSLLRLLSFNSLLVLLIASILAIVFNKVFLTIGFILFVIHVAVAFVMTRKAYKSISLELNQLKENLERSKPLIRHAYISMLLEGNTGLERRQTENEKIAGVKLEHPRFLCFVLHLKDVGEEARQEVLLKQYALVNALESSDPYFRIYAVQDGDDNISGFVNFIGPVDAEAVIVQIMNRIDQLLVELSYTLAVSGELDWSHSAISLGYEEANIALTYEFLYGHQVMRFDQLSIPLRREKGPVLRYMQAFEKGLAAANEEKVLQAVNQTVAHLSSGCYSIKFCKQTLFELVVIVRRQIQSQGYDPEEWLEVDLRDYESEVRYLASFADWFRPFVHKVINKGQESQPQADLELSHTINQFIEQNLHQQISLLMVSEYLNVSEGHASKVFKTVIGRSFT
ncbi:MAG: hypothetical protein K0Q73_8214, partial [Paenibacillus sp.]|nr:hypothetical protein [Paenibacillus sp.]